MRTTQVKDVRGPEHDATSTTPAAGIVRGALSGLARTFERELPRYLFYALAAAVALCVALAIGAEAALAQEGGGEGQGEGLFC